MDHSEVKHFPKVDHTPAELDEASKQLLQAADLLEKRGLSKGCLSDGEGRLCINGALLHVMFGKPDWDDRGVFHAYLYSEARLRLERHFNGEPAMFNNLSTTTKEQVVSKLRAVALGL